MKKKSKEIKVKLEINPLSARNGVSGWCGEAGGDNIPPEQIEYMKKLNQARMGYPVKIELEKGIGEFGDTKSTIAASQSLIEKPKA